MATLSAIAVGLLLAAGAAGAPSASSIRPAPGTPDPKKMVLTSADVGGARVTLQRYYQDPDFPSTISYERELEDGRLGSTPLPYVSNGAEVGVSVLTTTRFLATQRRLFGTKEFRALLVESFEAELPIDGFVTNVQVGRPRNLGVGAGSFDLLVTARVLGLRWEFHLALFRVERVLGVVGAAGEPGRRLPLSVMTRLAKIMAGRMSTELVPRNTELPTISGNVAVGQTLTATTGTWTESPTSFAYQWQRCDPAGANCSSIAGAVSQAYATADADVGSTLRVSVTARNAAGAATAVSAPTGVVSAAGAPISTSPPTISGTPQVGQTLTAGTGSWTGGPTSFAIQWQRCNASATGCVDVAGATATTYVLGTADVGATIRVVVTATNVAGRASAASAVTAVVT
ncbi:MAG: hypothetical protein ACRDPV_08030 [Gaiellaceae bacterium]